jgi:hypothetical protein
VTTAAPDRGGLAVLAGRIGGFGGPVYAAIESMNGARFVHDQLEMAGLMALAKSAQMCSAAGVLRLAVLERSGKIRRHDHMRSLRYSATRHAGRQ